MNHQKLKELLVEQATVAVVTVISGEFSGETGLIPVKNGKSVSGKIAEASSKLAQLLQDEPHLAAELIKLGEFSIANQQTLTGEVTLAQGGVLKLLIEPILPEAQLLILGAGHIAKPLTQMAALIQLPVIVYDDRPDLANSHAFPQAERVICDSFAKLSSYQLTKPNTLVVVVTRGHQQDYTCLEQLLPLPLAYLGMVSSKRRANQVRERLMEEGFDPKLVGSIRAPIGLDIGASTPGEIAVSIIGELISLSRQDATRSGLLPGWRATAMDGEAQGVLKQSLSESKPLALATIIRTAGSTPRKAGAKMAVDSLGHIIGTIGGGCSEAQAKLVALDVLQTGEPQLVKVTMTDQVAAEEGMMCGGTMEVFIQRVEASHD